MKNVVDLLIQVAADALGLDIYIYQKNDENVQVLKYSGGLLCKPVHVKFTHNNIHSQANHYDAILKEIKEDPDCNLHLLSDVALQTINIDFTIGRNYTNTQTFHGPVNNTSVTNHQIIDNRSSKSIYCSMDTQQTPSPPPAHHVLKTQNNIMNDAVLDLSMKNKHKLHDNADLINCLSDENYEMPTPDDEDLEIIGFDPAFTNEVTSQHQASTNTTTTTSNSSNQRNIPKIGRGRPFPRYLFHDLEPEVVTSIPTDIDGMKYYKVKTSIKTWHKDTLDLHYFILKTTSKAGVYGNTIKTGSCHGSWICPNKSCPFVGTSHEHQPNKVNWRCDPICKGVQICKICDTYAVREGCGARKLVEFDAKSQVAIVYHLGKHTCWN